MARRPSSVTAFALLVALALAVAAVWAYVFIDLRQAGASMDPDPAPSPTSSSTSDGSGSSPTQDEGEWSMDDARSALEGENSRVLVLGDSMGNGPDEWVRLWAESAGLEAASWTGSGYAGESDGTQLWNGSMTEATAQYPLEHWEEILPPKDPDLVLLSFGHFAETPEGAADAMGQLRTKIAEEVPEAPIVVVLQNPEADDANQETREAIAGWAKEQGLPTVDVAQAFEESDQPLTNLRFDEMNPSQAGSELWAETVADALGTG